MIGSADLAGGGQEDSINKRKFWVAKLKLALKDWPWTLEEGAKAFGTHRLEGTRGTLEINCKPTNLAQLIRIDLKNESVINITITNGKNSSPTTTPEY